MRCPNCRCVVPLNSAHCCYCGYSFQYDSAKTLSVNELYDDMVTKTDYYNFSYAEDNSIYNQGYSVNDENYVSESSDRISIEIMLIIFFGLCFVFLLFLIDILILLL